MHTAKAFLNAFIFPWVNKWRGFPLMGLMNTGGESRPERPETTFQWHYLRRCCSSKKKRTADSPKPALKTSLWKPVFKNQSLQTIVFSQWPVKTGSGLRAGFSMISTSVEFWQMRLTKSPEWNAMLDTLFTMFCLIAFKLNPKLRQTVLVVWERN